MALSYLQASLFASYLVAGRAERHFKTTCKCMRPEATSVGGLKLLAYAAFSYYWSRATSLQDDLLVVCGHMNEALSY